MIARTTIIILYCIVQSSILQQSCIRTLNQPREPTVMLPVYDTIIILHVEPLVIIVNGNGLSFSTMGVCHQWRPGRRLLTHLSQGVIDLTHLSSLIRSFLVMPTWLRARASSGILVIAWDRLALRCWWGPKRCMSRCWCRTKPFEFPRNKLLLTPEVAWDIECDESHSIEPAALASRISINN